MKTLLSVSWALMHSKPSSDVDKSESPKLPDNDNLYDNEELHAYVDKVEQNYKKMKEVADAMPSFKLVPNFDDEECGKASDAINLSACNNWIPDEDAGYISCFLKGNKKLLADMGRKLKEIVDYCMFKDESVDYEEHVFSAGQVHFVSRTKIASLEPFKRIWTSIINAWSLILNHSKEFDRSNKTFFFDTGHSCYVSKIVYGEEGNAEEYRMNIVNCWKNWMPYNSNIDFKLLDMVRNRCYISFCVIVKFILVYFKLLDMVFFIRDVGVL